MIGQHTRKSRIIRDLKYGKYVALHKIYVYLEGRKLGLSRWQLFIHDFTKFGPVEWNAYAEFFYGASKEQLGAPTQVDKAHFQNAWNRHIHRNPHHWQFFVVNQDDGTQLALPMPVRYVREMVADWRGAGRAQGQPDTVAWYLKRKDGILLHPDTREQVEQLLGISEWVAG